MRPGRAVFICGLLAIVGAGPAWAQRETVTSRLLVGSTDPTQFGDVLRILGMSTTSSGNGTINPVVIDGDGDVLRNANASVDTSGVFTFGTGSGAGVIRVNGASGSSKGLWFRDAGVDVGAIQVLSGQSYMDLPGLLSFRTPGGATTFAALTQGGQLSTLGSMISAGSGTAVSTAALGYSNTRIGVASTSPRIILEDAGFDQWEMDNVDGLFRLVRMNSAGTVDSRPLQIDGNINVQPLGRRILPVEPYGVDLGSQQYKFGAAWFGDAYFDRLVTIENIGTVDNRWLIGSGNALDSDLSPSATTMVTRYNNYGVGDFVYLQKFARTEFIKILAGPTLTNKITNGSFESGAATNWFPSGGSVSATAVTTKSFHGEYSMLVDASSSPSFVANGAFGFTTGTPYTVCFYARRVDGATMANGAVSIFMRDAFVDAAAQQTQTDGWARFCRTAVAGANATVVPIVDTKGVDMYLDAIQIEESVIEQPYSEYRAGYAIARNEELTGVANQWYRGDGMFGVNNGWIDCYAIRGIKSATEQGPACVVNVRNGSSFNSWAPAAAWGQLDGLYGISGSRWGFRAGTQSLTTVGADTSEGFTVKTNGVMKVQFDISGNGFLDGSLTVRNNLTVGTSGAIMSGATGYDTNAGYWLAYNGGTPQMRVGTPTGAPTPRYLRWTGSALEVKNDTLTIDSSGIRILGGTGATSDNLRAYGFDFGDGFQNGLHTYGSGVRQMDLKVTRNGATRMELGAQNTSGTDAFLALLSQNGGTGSRVSITAGDLIINGSTGYTGSCAASATLTVTNGLITGGC